MTMLLLFHQVMLLWVGLFSGFFLGAWVSYRFLRAEIYEYIKASRRDQATIHSLQSNPASEEAENSSLGRLGLNTNQT